MSGSTPKAGGMAKAIAPSLDRIEPEIGDIEMANADCIAGAKSLSNE
jgi:hypothetical protein